MKHLRTGVIIIALLLTSLVPLAAAHAEIIHEVKCVKLFVLKKMEKGDPPKLVIVAIGTVPTSGWTNPAHCPNMYI